MSHWQAYGLMASVQVDAMSMALTGLALLCLQFLREKIIQYASPALVPQAGKLFCSGAEPEALLPCSDCVLGSGR